MQPLVADRIADAGRRQGELAAFSARVAGVHAQLLTPAAAGACGPDCGCTVTAPPGRVPVTLSHTRPAEASAGPWREVAVACTLDGTALQGRTADWRRITLQASDRQDTADGVRVTFPATPELAAEVAAVAAAEQGCCAFFDFTLHLTPTALELTVRAPTLPNICSLTCSERTHDHTRTQLPSVPALGSAGFRRRRGGDLCGGPRQPLPRILPLAFAITMPSRVRWRMRLASNSATTARICRNLRPNGAFQSHTDAPRANRTPRSGS
jgi:hypothetical protein